jgi:cytochrome oxidase Cu insertion factor (SCO1/SenC/PrrC family)
MRAIRYVVFGLGLFIAVSATDAFAEIPTGPEVGEPIPRFEARDQTGTVRTFEDLRGPNGLLLLFYRTADW